MAVSSQIGLAPNDLLNREQAAELLGISSATLATWASRGRYALPYVRVGRRVRYRRSDLERWIEQRLVVPTAQGEA